MMVNSFKISNRGDEKINLSIKFLIMTHNFHVSCPKNVNYPGGNLRVTNINLATTCSLLNCVPTDKLRGFFNKS